MVLSDAAEARRQRILLKRERAKLESEQQLDSNVSVEGKIEKNASSKSEDSEAQIKQDAKKLKLKTSDVNTSSNSNEGTSQRHELDIPDSETIISNVHRYLKQEYKFMKLHNGDADLSILAPVRARTAAATGVTKTTVSTIVRDKRKDGKNKLKYNG